MEKNYEKYNDVAELLKVIAHPIRLCIVSNLLSEGESNVTDMQECLEIPQSTLSQHLQKLRSARVIEGKRKGIEIYYQISDIHVAELIKALLKLKTSV